MPMTDLEIAQLFNAKPKKGIEKLKERYPEVTDDQFNGHIADFLHEKKSLLDSAQVGDYLSEAGKKYEDDKGQTQHSPNKVLRKYTEKLDFKDKDFVPALREYLAEFKLPGESQKIDRVVEAFGAKYINANPQSEIANADAAYILAFQTIMLNTELHNPNVVSRMSLEGLERNVKGINNKQDFSHEFLANLYNDIKTTPIAFPAVPKAPQIVLTSDSGIPTLDMKGVQAFLTKLPDGSEILKWTRINTETAGFVTDRETRGTITVTLKDGKRTVAVSTKDSAVAFTVEASQDKKKVIITPSYDGAGIPDKSSLALAVAMAKDVKLVTDITRGQKLGLEIQANTADIKAVMESKLQDLAGRKSRAASQSSDLGSQSTLSARSVNGSPLPPSPSAISFAPPPPPPLPSLSPNVAKAAAGVGKTMRQCAKVVAEPVKANRTATSEVDNNYIPHAEALKAIAAAHGAHIVGGPSIPQSFGTAKSALAPAKKWDPVNTKPKPKPTEVKTVEDSERSVVIEEKLDLSDVRAKIQKDLRLVQPGAHQQQRGPTKGGATR